MGTGSRGGGGGRGEDGSPDGGGRAGGAQGWLRETGSWRNAGGCRSRRRWNGGAPSCVGGRCEGGGEAPGGGDAVERWSLGLGGGSTEGKRVGLERDGRG